MTVEAYQAEVFERALLGDAEAGVEALRICRAALESNQLTHSIRCYLAERITDVLEGIPLDKALCVHKGPGRPKDTFPQWKQHLGALAALLAQRNYKPKQIAKALCDERAAASDRPLEDSDAHKIRKAYQPMQDLDTELLMDMAGPYRKVLSKYPPPE